MPHSTDSPYAVLQLKPGASMDEVRLAHQHLARQCDPARFPADCGKQAEANLRLARINEAFALLTSAAGLPSQAAPRNHFRWAVPAGVAGTLLLLIVVVMFPPMPDIAPPSFDSSASADAAVHTAAPASEAMLRGETPASLSPLPWTVVVEPPSAPLSAAAPPQVAPRAAEPDGRTIWVPASTNAAAAGMSWSLNSPGLRPRAVPTSNGGAKTP